MTTTHIFGIESDGRLLPRGNDLTAEQLEALDLGRHIVVTAGAGSGKTRTLSRRVLRILGEFAWCAVTDPTRPARGPRNILVSTFTERAAAELQERIREELLVGIRELEQRVSEFEADPAIGAGLAASILRQLRVFHRDLDQSRIGTFHGFCSAILREFAADMQLDPGFTILQGADHIAAVAAVVEKSLSDLEAPPSAARSVSTSLTDSANVLFRAFSRRALTELLQDWLGRRGELQAFSQVLQEHSDDELIERWARCYGEADLADLEAGLGPGSTVLDLLSQIEALGASYTGPADRKPPIFAVSAEALVLATLPTPSKTAARGQRLREFLSPFLTSSKGSSAKSLRKAHHSWLGSKKLFTSPEYQQLSDAWGELRAAFIELFGESGAILATLPAEADEAGLPILRALDAVAGEVVGRFQERKRREAQLDFTDLELELYRLLRDHDRARARLQRRYEHLLIDEFQDTNAVQWNIVKLLAGDPLPDRGLFLVGDPKQAIYRFRGGDVTLFDRAIAEICSAKNPALNFSANFRSRAELIACFNHLFAWLMHGVGPDRPSWEAPFTELSSGRTLALNSAPGQVEMLWLQGDASTADDDDSGGGSLVAPDPLLAAAMPMGREAALVAQRLRDEHLPNVTEHKGIKAAILLRRRAHLPAYAFALRQAGVPHVVARGRGFFARQEVLDVANLLLSLSSPDDGIALIGALRGPFLGLEDAWLLWLSTVGAAAGKAALTNGWQSCVHGKASIDHSEVWLELPEAGRAAILTAASQFHRWQLLRKHLPLSAFLRELFRESAAFHMFHLSDASGQALANIEKLQALAAGYDNRGAEGLADFALFLRDQEEVQNNEGDASIDATASVVLMTIHQSKGLEFPIVVLPDLQQKISISDTRSLGCARLGERVQGEDLWELGLRVPIEDGQRRHEPMVLRNLIRERDREEQLAESRRLLYVAMTRARDRLICVSQPPSKAATPPRGHKESKSWEEWLRSWLAAGGDEYSSVHANSEPDPTLDSASPINQAEGGPQPSQNDIAPLPVDSTTVITPHALAAPTAKTRRSTKSATDLPARLGKLRGLLVHSCLEDGLYEPGEETERRLSQALAREGLPDLQHLSALRLELERHLAGFLAAAPPQLLADEQSVVFRELPFQLALPGQEGWLKGIIDLVYRDDERRCWVVVDYKSDTADIASLTDKYRAQLTAYAWAVSQVLPDITDTGWQVESQLLCTAHGSRVVVSPAATAAKVEVQFSALLAAHSCLSPSNCS